MRENLLILTSMMDNLGGWIPDTQFVLQNNTVPVMAHGLGQPVQDASTSIEVDEDGDYRIWVRTRDWTKYWSRKGSAGLFEVLVDGQAIPVVFGNGAVEWHWQAGGVVTLAKGVHTIALHDLTGFDGRCDAILLTRSDQKPSDSPDALSQMRREWAGIDDTVTDTRFQVQSVIVICFFIVIYDIAVEIGIGKRDLKNFNGSRCLNKVFQQAVLVLGAQHCKEFRIFIAIGHCYLRSQLTGSLFDIEIVTRVVILQNYVLEFAACLFNVFLVGRSRRQAVQHLGNTTCYLKVFAFILF